MHPVLRAEPVRLVDQRLVADRAEQRDVLGAGRVDPARQVLGGGLHRVRAHHPVGRVLAAGDGDQPGRHPGHRVLPGQLGRLLALPGQQRPQARVHALDVVVGQRHRQHLVDVLEDVVDVGLGRRRVREVEMPVGVGGSDDPVRLPRDDEQHRLLGLEDDAALRGDPVARAPPGARPWTRAPGTGRDRRTAAAARRSTPRSS